MGFGVNFGNSFESGPQVNLEANLAEAISRLQENLPETTGEAKNTYEEDGKYFAMGLEVSAQGYNEFMKKYELVLEQISE